VVWLRYVVRFRRQSASREQFGNWSDSRRRRNHDGDENSFSLRRALLIWLLFCLLFCVMFDL
jgi:hypothetical protein